MSSDMRLPFPRRFGLCRYTKTSAREGVRRRKLRENRRSGRRGRGSPYSDGQLDRPGIAVQGKRQFLERLEPDRGGEQEALGHDDPARPEVEGLRLGL